MAKYSAEFGVQGYDLRHEMIYLMYRLGVTCAKEQDKMIDIIDYRFCLERK